MKVDLNIQKSFAPEVRELFDILAKVAKEKSPNTEVFAVGGFVRDAMIGQKSDDVDIMVYPISGKDFAYIVTNYLGSKDPHVIKKNPEKSKNLETVKSKLKLPSGIEMEVDFAQARSEVYTENSRIPIAKPDTPEADAYRRDFTLNSMMWRIYPYPQEIKDFTGRGIQDLISDTLRTPLDPLITFKEDPIRIFRCIRFSSKYNFSIDPATYEAMKDPSIKDDIKKKLARERSATEIEKMLKGPNPAKAISLLKETGLLSDILEESLKGTKYEGKMSPLDMNQDNPNHTLSLWGHTMQVVYNVLEKYQDADAEKRMVMVLSALFHDLGKLYSEIQTKRDGTEKYPGHEKGYTSYLKHEEESAEISNLILKFLKLDPLIKNVSELSRAHMQPHSLLRSKDASQKALRKFIRRCSELSLNWLDVFNLSVADAYSKSKEIDPSVVQNYKELENSLNEALLSLSVKTDEKIKPILDGNEIMSILGIKPGPKMKEVTEFVKELRDENPNITKEEAAAKLKEKFSPVSPSPSIPIKEAAKDKKKTSTCSQQLIHQKSEDINKLFEGNRLYEINSILKELIKDYSKNEQIARLVTICTFKILCKDMELKDINILQYIFEYANENFFDYIIGSYVLGILLITDTATKEDVFLEIANRMNKLSPSNLKFVMDLIPAKKVINKGLFNKIIGITK